MDGSIAFLQPDERVIKRISLPCGKCRGCIMTHASTWMVRATHEAQCHEFNCFVTLTYDDEHLPENAFLVHADFQKFMKRLRKRFTGLPIRYLMCGEYGSETFRPHFHVCLFGVDFSDRKEISRGASGLINYESSILASLWSQGLSTVSPFEPATAGYVARYSTAKLDQLLPDFICPTTGVVLRRPRPYVKSSTHPGLGAAWFSRFGSDVFPQDEVVVNSQKYKVPRYYEKLFKRTGHSSVLESVKADRVSKMRDQALIGESSRSRLAVREEVFKARTSTLKRNL